MPGQSKLKGLFLCLFFNHCINVHITDALHVDYDTIL